MSGTKTFIEHDILTMDAGSGRTYSSFQEFWETRMEPMQFIAADAKGALADVRANLKEQAESQFAIFQLKRLMAAPAPWENVNG